MDIFESLENLNVSEECFDDIMDLVEELTKEKVKPLWGYDLTNKTARKKGLGSDVWDRAVKTLGNHVDNMSSQEKDRWNKGRDEVAFQTKADGDGITRSEKYNRFWDGDNRYLAKPEYQNLKKLAKKALKGHTLDGTENGETTRDKLPTVNPKKLFRIGRAVQKQQGKGTNESLEMLEHLLEDLRSLQRNHRENLRRLHRKVTGRTEQMVQNDPSNPRDPYKYTENDVYYDNDGYADNLETAARVSREDAEKRHGMPAYKRNNRNTRRERENNDDYMDVIARKSPGVSFTSDEWHDND
jgi:hypothetical protein